MNMRPDMWDALADKGVLASVHIGRPRFEQRLALFTEEDAEGTGDLGLHMRTKKERDAVEQMIRAGVKLLLPPDYHNAFRTIESSARHALTRSASLTQKWNEEDGRWEYDSNFGSGYIFGFDTELGPFIPRAMVPKFLEKMAEYRVRYMATKDELIEHYPAVQREVVASYADIAAGAWARLRKVYPGALGGQTQTEFVRRYVAAIRASFPAVEEIESKTYFDVRTRPIGLPASLREDVAATAEAAMIRTMTRQTVRDDVERISQQLTEQMYSLLWKAAADAEQSISRGDRVPPKSLGQLRALGDQVRGLNVNENPEIERLLVRVESAVGLWDKPEAAPARLDELRGALAYVRGAATQRLAKAGMNVRMLNAVGSVGTARAAVRNVQAAPAAARAS